MVVRAARQQAGRPLSMAVVLAPRDPFYGSGIGAQTPFYGGGGGQTPLYGGGAAAAAPSAPAAAAAAEEDAGAENAVPWYAPGVRVDIVAGAHKGESCRRKAGRCV